VPHRMFSNSYPRCWLGRLDGDDCLMTEISFPPYVVIHKLPLVMELLFSFCFIIGDPSLSMDGYMPILESLRQIFSRRENCTLDSKHHTKF